MTMGSSMDGDLEEESCLVDRLETILLRKLGLKLEKMETPGKLN